MPDIPIPPSIGALSAEVRAGLMAVTLSALAGLRAGGACDVHRPGRQLRRRSMATARCNSCSTANGSNDRSNATNSAERRSRRAGFLAGEHRIIALYEPSGSVLKPGRSNEILHFFRTAEQ